MIEIRQADDLKRAKIEIVSFRCHLGVVEVSPVYTVEALDVGVALGFDCRPIEGPVDGHI